MPYIPQIKVGGTTYDVHDKRVDDLKSAMGYIQSNITEYGELIKQFVTSETADTISTAMSQAYYDIEDGIVTADGWQIRKCILQPETVYHINAVNYNSEVDNLLFFFDANDKLLWYEEKADDIYLFVPENVSYILINRNWKYSQDAQVYRCTHEFSLVQKLKDLVQKLKIEEKSVAFCVSDPSDFINGNVDGSGNITTNDTYAIRSRRGYNISRGSFTVDSLLSGYNMYAVGFDSPNRGTAYRLYNQNGSEIFQSGDYCLGDDRVSYVYFVFAHNPVGANIQPSDLSTINPKISVFYPQKTELGSNSYSRKGAKLLPIPGQWTDIVSETGSGIIENMFFAGDYDVKSTQIAVIVDDNIYSINGFLYELIGIRNDAENTDKYGTEYFGKTGAKNGIYLNYKIPYYKNFKVAILSASVTNPYVWFTVKTSKWHPITIAGVDIPYGAYFRAIRNNAASVASGDYVNLYESNKNGVILGTIMVAKGATSSWFMEGMIRAYEKGSETPELIASGLEDYFYGTYYFGTGKYYFDVAGCSYINNETHLFAGYRFHTHDSLSHEQGGYILKLRNNDINVEDESSLQNETTADYVWYVMNYQW